MSVFSQTRSSLARTLRDHWLALCLLPSYLPLVVFAYLGTFSRLMNDDYCFFGTGLALGPWGNMLHWRAYRNGHYSNVFLHGLIAPVGTDAVRIFPTLIILLWLIGLFFLARRALSCAGVQKHRITIALVLAGTIVSATLNASLWQQVIFWYTASVAYTLPLAVLTIYARLMWELLIRHEERRPPIPLIAAGVVVCFLNAGFAAFHMLVQLGIFTLAIPALAFVSKRSHRNYIIVIGSGWLATIASLFVQLSAPGVAIRATIIAENVGVPDRSLTALLSRTAGELLLAAQKPELLAGIIFAMSLGLFLALMFRFLDQQANRVPFRLSRPALVFGLCIQLIFLPLLWMHTSDTPQLLGRFSIGYLTVVIANALLILIFALLVFAVHRVNSMLVRYAGSWLIFPCATLFIVAALFALTQFQSIHWRASSYLFFTIQLLLLVLAWQLARPLPAAKSRRFAAFAAWAYITAWAVNAPVVFATVHTLPIVPERLNSPLYLFLILNGLIWGIFLGYAISLHKISTRFGIYGLGFLRSLCLVMLAVIGIGMAIGLATNVPLLNIFSEEWDSRHQDIVAQIEMSQDAIVVEPLSANLKEFMKMGAGTIPCADDYYRVDVLMADRR